MKRDENIGDLVIWKDKHGTITCFLVVCLNLENDLIMTYQSKITRGLYPLKRNLHEWYDIQELDNL